MLNRQRRFFEENNWNESSGGWEDNSTDNHDTPNDWAGEKKEDSTSIPKARFDEVNETPVVYHWKYKMEDFGSLIGTAN